MAQLHSQPFKCTVHSRKTTRSDWPIPFNHVEQARENVVVDGKPVAESVQIVAVTNAFAGRKNNERLIVAVTPRQVIRLRSAKSSGTVFIQLRQP